MASGFERLDGLFGGDPGALRAGTPIVSRFQNGREVVVPATGSGCGHARFLCRVCRLVVCDQMRGAHAIRHAGEVARP